MVTQLTSGVSRRFGAQGHRWWQIATHWGAYVRYLERLERHLGRVSLPGLKLLCDIFSHSSILPVGA